MKTRTEQLFDEMKECKKRIDIDPLTIHRNSRPGFVADQRVKRDRYDKLRGDYTDYLKSHCVALFLDGNSEDQTRFADIAHEELNVIAVNGSHVYDRLTEGLFFSIGKTQQYTATQHARLIQEIRLLMADLGIEGLFNMPAETGFLRVVKTEAECRDHVRELVRDTSGDRLNVTYLSQEITDQGIEGENSGEIIPVIVTGTSPI